LLTLCNGSWLPQQLMLTLLILRHEKIIPNWVRGLMICQLWRWFNATWYARTHARLDRRTYSSTSAPVRVGDYSGPLSDYLFIHPTGCYESRCCPFGT
jgi:hypothetical protein